MTAPICARPRSNAGHLQENGSGQLSFWRRSHRSAILARALGLLRTGVRVRDRDRRPGESRRSPGSIGALSGVRRPGRPPKHDLLPGGTPAVRSVGSRFTATVAGKANRFKQAGSRTDGRSTDELGGWTTAYVLTRVCARGLTVVWVAREFLCLSRACTRGDDGLCYVGGRSTPGGVSSAGRTQLPLDGLTELSITA
jgi:hypothetical protein